jgi:4'-phosphopantetheinyl transferase
LDYTETIALWHGVFSTNATNYLHYWRTLDDVEKARANAIKDPLRQSHYVQTHGRLRLLLAQTLNESPDKINITTTKYGKPYLVDYPHVVFNLAHSDNRVMIAISEGCQLGVDIERCKPRTTLPLLANKCFADIELCYWNKLPEVQKIREFYRFWTRKEAFVKATGRGIGLGLRHCVINPENPSKLLDIPSECGRASHWTIQDIQLGKSFCAAVATNKKQINVRVFGLEI